MRIGLILLACSALGACGSMGDRIKNIGEAPQVTRIENPTVQPGYQPVSLPMPSPKHVTPQRNSLWKEGRTTFFEDQRASDIGDIFTVLIEIDDQATLDNESSRSRTSGANAGLPALGGIEQALDTILPEAVDPSNLVSFDSDTNHNGTGSIEREEEVSVQLAAIITQILPNGNMVIRGSQEVVVNFEKRILQIDGVIRPEDISLANDISYEKIAEARISYGGEGQLTDVQQPQYGQQLYDIVFPF